MYVLCSMLKLTVCTCTMQYAETYPVEERNVVKQVRVGKGKNSKRLTQPWARFLRESERQEVKDIFLCSVMLTSVSVSEVRCYVIVSSRQKWVIVHIRITHNHMWWKCFPLIILQSICLSGQKAFKERARFRKCISEHQRILTHYVTFHRCHGYSVGMVGQALAKKKEKKSGN